MEFNKILNLIILLVFYVVSLEIVPTFGDEFVHIKVHVPKDVASARGILKSTYPGSPQYPHTSHKVIHHYHRRRKPLKKSPPPSSGPLLEGIILAELDKPHVKKHEQPLEETFVVEKVPSDQKINTFRVIEETLEEPAHNDYKVTKTSPEYNKDHVETYRVVENSDPKDHSYEHVDKSHVESVKLVEEKQNYRYLHHTEDSNVPEYTKQKPRQEIIKIIEEPEYKTSEQYKGHSSYHHHDQIHDSDESQHYHYKTPLVESVEIIKSKKSPSHDPHSKYYENDESEDFNDDGYQKETIEIIKTKTSPKYHHSSEYESQDHQDFHSEQNKIIQLEKEIIYAKPREEYENHRVNVKPIYSYSSKNLIPVIEEQIEYESPSEIYKGEDHKHGKPSVIYRKYGNSRDPSTTRNEHPVYGSKDNLRSDYHYSSAATDSYHTDHGEHNYYQAKYPSTATQSQKSYYYPSPQRDTEEDKISYRYKIPLSYASSYETGHYVASPQTTLTKDSNLQGLSKYLASSASSLYGPHDGLYDKQLPPVVKQSKLHTNIDWPEGVGNPYTTETYSGYDSYSAGHVQGVDSGGYNYSP